MVAWTVLQWWRVKLDAQGAENVNGGVAVLFCARRWNCGGVAEARCRGWMRLPWLEQASRSRRR